MVTSHSSPAGTTYEFTLIVYGPGFDDDRVADALYEAGCGDGLLNDDNGVQTIDFEREAATLYSAVLSAIADVESVEGFRVVRVVDIDLLAMSEIAERTGRTRESVRLLANGSRGPGGFPPPINRNEDRRYHLWRWAEVAAWFDRHEIDGVEALAGTEGALTVINAALDLRLLGSAIEPDARAELRKLVDQGLAA
jgi:hypothetical protein